MKRICYILAIVLCFANITTAFASAIDLSTMTLDELVELRKNVDTEIENRIAELSATHTLIYPSIYVVGKDIKAGEYIFTNNTDDYSQFNWWETEESYKNKDKYQFECLYEGDIYRFVLQEGMVFELCNRPCKIEMAPPMIFAP